MLEFLFKYSSEVYGQGQFIFANSWPVWVLILAFILSSLIIIYTLIKNRQYLSTPRLITIGFLQALMLVLVLLVVWQPSLLIERLRAGDNAIAMLLDTSESMAYGDNELSRIEQARTLAASKPVTDLKQEYQFKQYIFSDTSNEVESFDELPPPASETRIADSILKVLRQASTTSLGAIILLSDGIDNSGTIDQEQLAEISSYGVPVHTIGIGRENIPEDIELSEVVLPEKALPNSTLSARVSLRHDAGGEARVKIYDGDKFVASRQVVLNENDSTTTAWLDFKLDDTGSRDLHFSVDPVMDERNLLNNNLSRVIDIPEESYRILYVEGEPRWEYKFMRRALEDDSSINLVTLLRVSTNKFYRQGIETPEELEDGFPVTKSGLYRYQALIIGSLEAPLLTPEQQGLVHDFVNERGGSLLMLAGPNGLANGRWGNTVIGDLLPSKLPDSQDSFKRERAKALLTPVGRQSPVLKLSDDLEENEKLWRELPDIADYQDLGALRPAARTLLNVDVNGRQQPLLVTQPYGRGHSYILASGGTWRWQMSLPVEDQRHETFWRQLVRGLVSNSPGSFELSTEISANKLLINAEIRNENFEPVNDLEITAVISQADGEPVSLDLIPSSEQPGMFQGEFTPEFPGLISVEAISRKGDDPLSTIHTSVYHDTGSAEYRSLRQNRNILERLADNTGGQYWAAEDIRGISDAIQLSRAGITEQDIRPLWDAPVIFIILVLIKAIEWLLRRRWRTI